MLALVLQPIAQIPSDVATKAGTTIVESGVLGALLIVSVLANIALVWLLFRVQNARVADTKAAGEVSNKMVEAFTRVNETMEDFNKSGEEQARALQALDNTMRNLLLLRIAHPGVLPPTIPPHGGSHNSNGETG